MTREEINQKAINAYPEKHGPMSSQEYRILDDKRAAYIRGWEDAEAHKKSDWISVEDRLPENEQVVLCIYDTEKFNGKLRLGVNIATFHTELDGEKNIFVSWDSETPKYWMPIPELRKED